MFRTALAFLVFCGAPAMALTITQDQGLDIPFQEFTLDNGLQVVVHEDHSDPLAAVIVIYHVGSGREQPGRSGFAHLFEHLMFQGSEHVGDDEHFRLVSEAGGTLNGTTNRDRTNYFETVPANQLELALWLEADRMGFLLPSVTQEKLDNQREVVKNERRQNYENRPYGQAAGALAAALYPAGHPYSWLTIGSHEDLNAASLQDVHGFFRRWYGPNNATLAIGGDVDPERVRELVDKYFGSIPRGPAVPRPTPRPVSLAQERRVVVEDTVKLPQLELVWPSVPRAHQDEAALLMLSSVLSANKASILDRALTVDELLASRVSAFQESAELAGEFHVVVRPVKGGTLDDLEQRVRSLLAKLGEDGVDADQLQRMQNRHESRVINGLETVWRRTNALAEAKVFLGDPGRATEQLARVMAVTPEQVRSVLGRYLLESPSVLVSVVPSGELGQVASGRTPGQLQAEQVLDRSVPPTPGPVPTFRPPAIWRDELANGVQVTGTPYDEIPVASLRFSVPAGRLYETVDTVGLASLTAELMNEGTESLDVIALTDAVDHLGATLRVSASDDEITLSLRTLNRHLPEAVRLLGDVLLHPRFAPEDFERLKQQRLIDIDRRGDSVRTVSSNVWRRLRYGTDGPQGFPSDGTRASVEALTLDDVKSFYRAHVVPAGARLTVVGALSAEQVAELLAPVTQAWKRAGPAPPLAEAPRPSIEGTRIYLVDKPGAPQSEIRIGHGAIAATDPDYYPLSVMNYSLGGSFSSRINMNLREDKGYTYGARSRFSGGLRPGTFTVSTGVRTDVTKESVQELMNELHAIREGLRDEEARFACDAMTRAMNRQYESVRSLGNLVDNVSKLGYPEDYPARRLKLLAEMTREQLDTLARQYIDPARVDVLIVGDAKTVRADLEELGYGEVIELDIDGNPLSAGS